MPTYAAVVASTTAHGTKKLTDADSAPRIITSVPAVAPRARSTVAARRNHWSAAPRRVPRSDGRTCVVNCTTIVPMPVSNNWASVTTLIAIR